jgi:hypothetical protein
VSVHSLLTMNNGKLEDSATALRDKKAPTWVGEPDPEESEKVATRGQGSGELQAVAGGDGSSVAHAPVVPRTGIPLYCFLYAADIPGLREYILEHMPRKYNAVVVDVVEFEDLLKADEQYNLIIIAHGRGDYDFK